MKAIIFAAGSDGDIHPHLGIGCELLARGHQVIFITTAEHLDAARACGFEALSFLGSEEKQDFIRATESLGVIAKIKRYCRVVADKIYECCELAGSRIDDRSILIAPPVLFVVARLLHEKYGTPYLSTLLAPANLYSIKDPPSFKSLRWCEKLHYSVRKPLFHTVEHAAIDPFFRMLLKASAEKLELPLPRHVISQWWHSPQKILGLFYEWYCQPPADWPGQVSLTGFPLFSPKDTEIQLTGRLEAFLNAGTPPIVFTPGTETHKCNNFFDTALKALQALGQRGIFLTRAAGQLPALPATVVHENYLPLNLLLPRASVLVHHGGIGTTAQAMLAGIPQLIIPGFSDQFDNGRRVERLGCGITLENPVDISAMTDKLRQLLQTDRSPACHTVQTLMRPGPIACGRAADVIEQIFDEARRMPDKRVLA
ncbi:glycosyltransferase [Dyella tabacisoli]|uniref:Glycosyltransferase n=1 Tax=Dyella tabacisoli TaxID=2282381 RepID=A0A369UKC0_9GAMM|nr:nucleotide disphospho-sugar-binding domain-containing protein [Dyella tabacisoli]RDD80168.1 glycosyltransferase [Dyella tabacisoli]